MDNQEESIINSKSFSVSNDLLDSIELNCVSLAINDNANGITSEIIGQPNASSTNATLTFVKSKGKGYAITCWHVIKFLRVLNLNSSHVPNYSFYSMTPRPISIPDNFIHPNSLSSVEEIDIGIMEISLEFIEGIGKVPFDIDSQNDPYLIEFGIAVGFPEKLKYLRDVDQLTGTQIISLPTVYILAEIDSIPIGNFKLFSELPEPHPYDSYSGMSGGPILWSNEAGHGIFGISYEVLSFSELNDKKSIAVAGVPATPENIRYWISQIPAL